PRGRAEGAAPRWRSVGTRRGAVAGQRVVTRGHEARGARGARRTGRAGRHVVTDGSHPDRVSVDPGAMSLAVPESGPGHDPARPIDPARGPAGAHPDGGSWQSLARFLVGQVEIEGAGSAGNAPRDDGIDPAVIEERGLAPYAFGRVQALPDEAKPDAATQAKLRTAYVLTRARHALVRKATRELLARWHEAGITVLLTKGFALAEFV